MQKINPEYASRAINSFIRDYVHKNGFKKTILGVSGGLDSALVLTLAVSALGADNVKALLMPYKLSSSESLEHGKLICEQLGVDYTVVDISESVDAYYNKFPSDNPMLLGNKCARERMSVLYDFSERERALVAGTSNKSELLIGYSTIYGDSAAAYMPIGDLYKTQAFELSEYLKIPEEIIQKSPSADLWENQTDEKEIGFKYKDLDAILFQLIDLSNSIDEITEKGEYKREDIEKIRRMIVNSHYKRTMPSILKLSNRTIGLDFRYPRDWER